MRASRTIRREVNGDAARREAPLTNAIGLSWPEAAAAEHEMRGLLHLLGMISYCLQFSPATEDERARWRREAACANARLERLRAAGWCPGL